MNASKALQITPGAVLIVAAIFTALALISGVGLVLSIGAAPFMAMAFGVGVSLGPCVLAYVLVRPAHKQRARKLVLLTGGATILGFSLLSGANLDMEGSFLLLFETSMGAAIGHTLATVLVGPLIFGRFLCGWGCWRAMVLELLPLGRSPGRRGGRWWRFLPYVGLLLAACAAAFARFVLHEHAGGVPGSPHRAAFTFLLAGFAAYYLAAVLLALFLKDRRAFCKYLCPNAGLLRWTSRVSLLKMAADAKLCTGCGACSRVCPMDIDVQAFARSGIRVGNGECILCQRCVHVCQAGAIRPTIGFDLGRGAALLPRNADFTRK